MAAKGSGGGGGAQLASGYISLNVKYASAMGQIADDFGAIEKKSKASGESITKNLVEVTKKLADNATEAKKKVSEVGDAYKEQKTKVDTLKQSLQGVEALEAKAHAARMAYANSFKGQHTELNALIVKEIELQKKLVNESDPAKIKALNEGITAAIAEQNAIREKGNQLEQEAVSTGKEYAAVVGKNAAVQEELSEAVAKGRELFEQYGKAVEDAKRKQDLASQSAEELKKKVGNTGGFSAWGKKLAQALGRPFTGVLTDSGDRAGRGFRNAFARQMDHAGRESSQKVKRMASGIWMGMTPGVMGAAGVGLAIGKAFQAGFDREETINTVKLRLQALGQSATAIQQLMSQAQGSVEGTQFSLADAFGAASTAMQSNIKAGPEMVQYLNNIANAAGLTGIAYGDVAESIGRVQRQGYVSMENIDPLVKKDLNVLGWLKDYYAKDFPTTTQTDITEMISKKMIPAEVLNKVLTANLNDSMKGLTKKTVKGATADLFTQIGKVTQSILQPFMGDLPTFLNGLGVKLKNFAEYIKPGMAVAAAWIKRTWNDLWPKVKQVFGATVDWLTDKWEQWWPTIKKTLEYIKSRWDNIFPSLKEKFESFVKAFGRAWTAMGPYVKAAAAVIGWAVLWIIDRLPLVTGWVNNILNWFATLLDWLREEFFPFMKKSWDKFYKDIKGAWESAITFKDKVVDAFTKLKETLTGWFDWMDKKWEWLKGLEIPGWVKWLSKTAFNIDLTSSSTPLVSGAGANVPKPARLTDSGHVPSGPQSKYVAGLLLEQFPGIKGNIGGSYLPMSEGGPSVPGTHDAGLSIDIPIGTSAEQRGMGDQIEKMLQENAKQLGIVYTIWKDVGKQTGLGGRNKAEFPAKPGSHQDHIDVMFDGKTFGEAVRQSVGSNGATYTIADASASSPMNLTDMFRQAGIDPAMFPLLQGFAKAEGSNPSGVPTLGFTDGQAGSSLAGHVAALAKQLKNRESVAGPFPGGSPEQQAAWMAKVVGQTGNPSDWQGNAQPPLADYIGRIVANMPRRQVSVDEFGGVANLSTEKPIEPSIISGMWGENGSATPKPEEPWWGGGGGFDAPSGGGGGGSWGDEEPGWWEKVGSFLLNAPTPNEWLRGINPGARGRVSGERSDGGLQGDGGGGSSWSADSDSILDVVKETLKEQFGINSAKDLWGRWQKASEGGIVGPLAGWNEDKGGIGSSAGLPIRRSKDGPKGTKDDPIITSDPEVADNTDPANQPDAGAAAEDSTVTATDTPHAGSGAAPGPVTPGSAAMTDAAEGLGGVAQSMFSNQFEGTPFSNPMDWPATKSVGALFTFFGNILGGNTGGGAGGLAGLLFPGSAAGGMDYKDQRQIRDSGQARDRKADAAKAAQAKVDEIAAKPFKFDEDEKKSAADDLVIAQQEANDALQDHTMLLQDMNQTAGGGAVGGLPGIIQNLAQGKPAFGDTAAPGASAMGPAALLPGGTTGFSLAPFGDMVTGTPGVAPGDPGLAPFAPGSASGASLPSPSGMISSASNAQPPQQHGQGGAPGPSLTINQTMTDATFAHGTDKANSAYNTAFRSDFMTMGKIT